jgi:hypothetical protein
MENNDQVEGSDFPAVEFFTHDRMSVDLRLTPGNAKIKGPNLEGFVALAGTP